MATICLGFDGTHVLNGAFYSLPYDVLNDFVPISPLATGSIVLAARKTMPAEDLSELIAWLNAHPNQASAGLNNLTFRLLAARLQKQTGTQFTIVPYRGVGSPYMLWRGLVEEALLPTQAYQLGLVRSLSRRTAAENGGGRRWNGAPFDRSVRRPRRSRGNASRTGAATLAGSLAERRTSGSARRPLLRNSDRRVQANSARCGAHRTRRRRRSRIEPNDR
jgi:hypothetical protein